MTVNNDLVGRWKSVLWLWCLIYLLFFLACIRFLSSLFDNILLFSVLCFRLREEEIKTRPGHFLILFFLLLSGFLFDNSFKLLSVESLRGIYALPFVSFVHSELILAPFIFNLAAASFITHFSKLESDATLLYLPELLIFVPL